MDNQKHFDIAEIKERVKIWDVMREFGHESSGTCKAVRSPLREETHPSFSIFANGDAAKDHGSGESYDCISLFMELSGCTKHEAIVGCGRIAGIAPSEIPPEFSVPPPPRSICRPDADVMNKRKGNRTLRERLGECTPLMISEMKTWGLSDLEENDGPLTEFCEHKRIPKEFMVNMVKAGVVGVLHHPALKTPAIAWIFDNPHFGIGCKLRLNPYSSRMTIWWKGRSQEHFFGEQLLQPSSGDSQLMIAEGESDALVLNFFGIPAVGVTGATVMPDPKITHYALSHRVVGVWYDADDAGRESTVKIQKHIADHSSGVKIVEGIGSKIPDGMDIGDCYEKWEERFSKYAVSELDKLVNNKQITTLD